MRLGHLHHRYFATDDLATVTPAAGWAGAERILVNFGLETDRDKRCALWCLLYPLGEAPDLDVAFEDRADQEAARNFMDLTAASKKGGRQSDP